MARSDVRSPCFDLDDQVELPLAARTAIQNATQRVQRASAADDVEQIIGTTKELVETVAKVVISALGGTYGSNTPMPKLARETVAALEMDPGTLGDRPALRQLGSALTSAVSAMANLRNSDGTGHGRAHPSNLDGSHATFAREAATAWCRWILSATHRRLGDRIPIGEVVADISGPLTMSRGTLPALLRDVRVHERGEVDQRKLGLAVARRWSVNGTFMPREDVLEPLAGGKADYSPAFAEGALEGLVLDHNGFLRMHDIDVPIIVGIAERLPGDRKERLFGEVAARADDALLSYAFKDEQQMAVVRELRRAAAEREGSPLATVLETIASRIEHLRQGEESSFDEE
jgi:hypothetical protein